MITKVRRMFGMPFNCLLKKCIVLTQSFSFLALSHIFCVVTKTGQNKYLQLLADPVP